MAIKFAINKKYESKTKKKNKFEHEIVKAMLQIHSSFERVKICKTCLFFFYK